MNHSAFDTNDCVVRAFRTAAQVRYEDAHAACELLGRKRNRGIGTALIIDRAMDLLDCTAEVKFDYMSAGRKVTLKKLVKDLPAGRYVATMAHHAFPIILEGTESGRVARGVDIVALKPLIRVKKVWRITPKQSAA